MKLAQSLHASVVDNSFRLNVRKRQFNAFNQEMNVVTIPSIGAYRHIYLPWLMFAIITVSEEKMVDSTADAKVYQDMITVIPPESISVPLILNGILEQVSRSEDIHFSARELLGRSSRQQSNGTGTRTTGWCRKIFARETDVIIDGSRTAESKLQDRASETCIDIAFLRPSRISFLNLRSRNPPV